MRVLPALALAACVVACNALSGADAYTEVPRCTGPLCGACPAGRASCGEVCCEAADRCGDATRSLCVPPCAEGTKVCGVTCCGALQHCVSPADGDRCSACVEAAAECGPSCCASGETCTDRERGVCSTTWSAAKDGQSCGSSDVCAAGDSCCTSITMEGGEFLMGRGTDGADKFFGPDRELPEHPATVSRFALDKYEVTVSRFRRFLEGWDYTPPPSGAGAHPHIAETGWRAEWSASLPTSKAKFESLMNCSSFSTYGKGDHRPINCVNWYAAFVFCAWDGGRLPTEAEWEYAAVNGDKNTLAPWGRSSPTGRANYGCTSCSIASILDVGSMPAGANSFGHQDLVGNVAEWVFDAYDLYPSSAVGEHADTAPTFVRVLRGGDFGAEQWKMRGAFRWSDFFTDRAESIGFRCARDPR